MKTKITREENERKHSVLASGCARLCACVCVFVRASETQRRCQVYEQDRAVARPDRHRLVLDLSRTIVALTITAAAAAINLKPWIHSESIIIIWDDEATDTWRSVWLARRVILRLAVVVVEAIHTSPKHPTISSTHRELSPYLIRFFRLRLHPSSITTSVSSSSYTICLVFFFYDMPYGWEFFTIVRHKTQKNLLVCVSFYFINLFFLSDWLIEQKKIKNNKNIYKKGTIILICEILLLLLFTSLKYLHHWDCLCSWILLMFSWNIVLFWMKTHFAVIFNRHVH